MQRLLVDLPWGPSKTPETQGFMQYIPNDWPRGNLTWQLPPRAELLVAATQAVVFGYLFRVRELSTHQVTYRASAYCMNT
jgi:hypothetical protein